MTAPGRPDACGHGGGARRFWRSPPGQPLWARPALLAIAALAALAYGWGMGTVNLEPYYGAAARSMSESWHNFIFGAFDPWGTVSVDKLPGALWVQALSLRVFGFHLWAIVLPQVVEGVLTVLVLYRAVRRVAGAAAGLVAALVLAVSPVTVLLNRGNISDSLLILLLVLAADATTRSFMTGRLGSLLMAGVWVGLAFQAKMLQAWIVLPALYLAYLVAAPVSTLFRRAGCVALSALVVVVVSLSWMTAVSAVPSHDRPYVDGSCDNSLFSQVFLYNGIERFNGTELSQPGCSRRTEFATEVYQQNLNLNLTHTVPKGWDRLLKGVFGRDDAWVLLPALVSAGGLLFIRRRRPRTDPRRASTTLWTTWLLITGIFFSSGQYLNSYYVAALLPPMAALCGMGAAVAWRRRHGVATRVTVLLTTVAGTVYALALLPPYVGVRPWIIGSTVAAAALAAGILGTSLRSRQATVRTAATGMGLAGFALLAGSLWATATVVASGEGPFDTPYQPARVTFQSQVLPARARATWPTLDRVVDALSPSVSVETFASSFISSYDIFATGREFLPVGGFSGSVPTPTLRQFIGYVAAGKSPRAAPAIAPPGQNPDMIWVVEHCEKQEGNKSTFITLGTTFRNYLCPSRHTAPAKAAEPTAGPR
jgi:4-amino-4-deoxy-L-arabinose transferase-like glycosyltransferase